MKLYMIMLGCTPNPMAGVFAGATVLAVEVDPVSIEKRLKTKYVDESVTDIDEAIKKVCGCN